MEFRLEVPLLLFETSNEGDLFSVDLRLRLDLKFRGLTLRHEPSHLSLTSFEGPAKFREGLILAKDNVRRRGMDLEINFKVPTITARKI